MFKMTVWTPNEGFTGKLMTALDLFDNFEPSMPTEAKNLCELLDDLEATEIGMVVELRSTLDGKETVLFLLKRGDGSQILPFEAEPLFDPTMAGSAVGLVDDEPAHFEPHELN